jgi:hypothetical protein
MLTVTAAMRENLPRYRESGATPDDPARSPLLGWWAGQDGGPAHRLPPRLRTGQYWRR